MKIIKVKNGPYHVLNDKDYLIIKRSRKELIELADLIYEKFNVSPNWPERLLKLQRENDRLEKELKIEHNYLMSSLSNSQNLFAKRKCESTEGYEQKYKSEKEYSKRLEKLLFNSIKNY